MRKILSRSDKNRIISGVCGGIGEYFNVDPSIVRIIFVVSSVFSFGFPFFLYIILWVIVPDKKRIVQMELEENDDLYYGDNVVDIDEEVLETKEKNKKTTVIITIILAGALIIAGGFLIFPEYVSNIRLILNLLIASFFGFLSIKIYVNMIKNKDYCISLFSVATIILTFAVFLILIGFEIINSGVLIEYVKYLIPGILIIVGISIIIKNIKNKSEIINKTGVLITFIILSFIGIISLKKATYNIFDANRLNWNPLINWGSEGILSENMGAFGNSFKLPENINRVFYKIENSAGSIKLTASDEDIEYSYTGFTPNISTNIDGNDYSFTFINKSSHSKLNINDRLISDLDIKISAGDFNAAFDNANIETLNVSLLAGNGYLKLPLSIKKIDLIIKFGNLTMEIPKDTSIKFFVSKGMANLNIPNVFENTEGGYIYQGKGDNTLEINAILKMGNLTIKLY